MDLFAVSSIILFFSSLGFGLFVYSRNRLAHINRSWFAFSASVSLWSIALYGVTSANTATVALRWQYLLDTAGVFVPVLYFYFISDFLNYQNGRARTVVGAIGTVFAVFSISSLFKEGVTMQFGFFWVNPGDFYALFPIFFFLLVAYSISMLLHELHLQKNALFREQIKYQLLGAFIGFSGGVTNFFPQIFGIFPFGNYFIILYIFFIGYSVLHSRLFNLRTIAIELFSAGVVLIFLLNFLTSQLLYDWLLNFILLVLVSFFSTLIIRSVWREVEQREELQKLTAELATANEELRQLDQTKSEFISIAGHQLRAPLTVIRGYISLILEGDFGAITDKTKDALGKISYAANQLVKLISDLLNLSRIEAGKIQYEFKENDLEAVAGEVVKEFEPRAKGKNVTLRLTVRAPAPGKFAFDADKLREVVVNLVDNAIKYSPSGGAVNIIIESVSGSSSKARLSVKDEGMGIAPAEVKRLFTKFIRTEDARKLDPNGMGIGLYFVRRIAEDHGGRAWAESAGPGKGSTFIIELPMDRKPTLTENSNPA